MSVFDVVAFRGEHDIILSRPTEIEEYRLTVRSDTRDRYPDKRIPMDSSKTSQVFSLTRSSIYGLGRREKNDAMLSSSACMESG
jgi:hypothetical protein